jgi:hypothetical protein
MALSGSLKLLTAAEKKLELHDPYSDLSFYDPAAGRHKRYSSMSSA